MSWHSRAFERHEPPTTACNSFNIIRAQLSSMNIRTHPMATHPENYRKVVSPKLKKQMVGQ